MSELRSQEMVERALGRSRSEGCVVLVEDHSEANLRWANNTLTTNGVSRGRDLTVVSVGSGGGVGVVSRQGVARGEMDAVVDAADAMASAAPAAEDRAPLVGAASSAGDWDAPPAATSIAVYSDFAPDLGESFSRARSGKRILYGFAHHQVVTSYIGSSTGLRCRHDQPTGHVEVNAKSSDLARSSWVGMPTADFSDVAMGPVHDELERRLGWGDRSVSLPAGRYDTVLPPSAVADLMIYLYWSADARNAHEGRTVFSHPGGGTRVGDRLSSAPLTLRSDPESAGLECSPFVAAHRSGDGISVFDNGSALTPTEWISEGVLSSLVQTRHSSRMTSLPFTPYVDNLILDSDDPAGGIERVVAGVERGLLLTCLWYIREVDPRTLLLTGLTRDGVYLIEGGEVTAAVNNFRFNESPVSVLDRATAAGTTERTLPREWCDDFTRAAMPALLVEGFNMSSVSQAS